MPYIGQVPATGENNSFKILDDITSYTLTFNGSYASVVSLADDTITKNEHRFITGQRVTYTHGGGTAIGGLTSGSVYYIVKNDQNTIKLAPSYADAIGSTNLINLSALGTGSSHTLNVAFDGVNTKFKATYDNGTKAGITRAAQLQISINGVIQRPYDSVTPPSGFGFDLDSVIVFSTAPVSTDVFWGNLVANNFPTFDIADNEIDNFIGDATTVSYTLSKTPANSQNILVTLDGVVQYPSDNDTTRSYTLSENVLTFDSAPGAGVFIQVRHIGFAGATSSSVTGFYGRTGNVALRYIDNVKVGNVDSVGFSTFTATGIGTVTIGIGTTALLVEGNARVTGILTVGNSSITIDGDTNKISIGDETTFIQNGAIGIGTTNLEGNALKVTGTTDITGNTTIGGNTTVGGNISLKSLDYAGISSTISDTAVDIFVYDTSKDSDGGAWRYKTQRTSWYNETLNTATRGSRREFPAVAVIVATTNTITIYDGDDPDLPMWMVFNGTGTWNQGLYFNGNTSGPLYALNGIIGWGDNNSAFGFITVHFIEEKANAYLYSSTYGGTSRIPLVNRNSNPSSTFKVNQSGKETPDIVNNLINDVAMTVLPNAPIDDATGLPIPTIAVATNGGFSVIKDDGTVIDKEVTGTVTNKVDWYKGQYLLGTGPEYWGLWKDLSEESSGYISGHADLYSAGNNSSWDKPQPLGLETKVLAVRDLIAGGSTTAYYSRQPGLSLKQPTSNLSNGSSNLLCEIRKDYNTGWMHGDIKGAFLSDTTVESLTANTNLAGDAIANGTNRLTSNNYDSGDTAWQMVDDSGTNNGYVKIEFRNLVVGQSYIISMTWDNNAALDGGYEHRISHKDLTVDENFTNFTHWNKTNASSETLTGSFVAQTTDNDNLIIYANAITLNVSNFIVRAVDDEDRSVNNKGLQVFGTITKSPVAGSGDTAAELVAYSGFSDGDYLKQPHNTSLEFGTGNFSCTVWFKSSTTDTSNYKGLVYLNRNGSIGEGFQILLSPSNGLYFYVYGPSNDFSGAYHNGYNDGNWHQISVSSTGTQQKVYIDGVLKETGNITTGSITDTNSELFVGKWYGNTSDAFYWRGSIALLRISGSIPSPEQIKKIYEDEKVLFQENAACTLYGSSDAVTALAYDEVNDLLHVGTSSGRSDFNGLRRINNTTTAVTTAISAYDGLIAAQ